MLTQNQVRLAKELPLVVNAWKEVGNLIPYRRRVRRVLIHKVLHDRIEPGGRNLISLERESLCPTRGVRSGGVENRTRVSGYQAAVAQRGRDLLRLSREALGEVPIFLFSRPALVETRAAGPADGGVLVRVEPK